MLKHGLRKKLEEYLEEIDFPNAISLVKMDVDDILAEILQEIWEERMLLFLIWLS